MNFFDSYYDAGSDLPPEERKEFFDAIITYYYSGVEPELTGVVLTMWKLVKPTVSISRQNAEKGKKGGAPKNNQNARKHSVSEDEDDEKKQPKNNLKTSQKQARLEGIGKGKGIGEVKDKDKGGVEPAAEFLAQKSNPRATGTNPRNVATMVAMIDEKGFPDDVAEAITDWVRYKVEKRQGYKPTGFKSFLTEVQNNVNQHGTQAVVDVIRRSMSQNYMGVTWDRLKESHVHARAPTGFDMGEYLAQKGGFG